METVFYIFVVMYVLCIAVELIHSHRFKLNLYDPKDTLVNLVMGAMAVLVRMATKGGWLALWMFLNKFAPFKIGESVASWVALFFLNEFVYYWFHRLSHENKYLWAVHVNHHSSEKLNFSTAARVPTFNIVLHNLFWIPLVLIGFDPTMIFAVETIGFLFAFFQHTQMIRRVPVVDYIFNVPSHHRVHHSCNPEYLNKNYGNVLIVFDRLFGTFKDEQPSVMPRYGLQRKLMSYNVFTVIFHEWVDLFRGELRQNFIPYLIGKLSRTTKAVLFLSSCFVAAAGYHAAYLIFINGQRSVGLHGIFVVIDLLIATGIIFRPKYFSPIFTLFALQQFVSHGQSLAGMWHEEGVNDWMSLGVLCVMAIGLTILHREGAKVAKVRKGIDQDLCDRVAAMKE